MIQRVSRITLSSVRMHQILEAIGCHSNACAIISPEFGCASFRRVILLGDAWSMPGTMEAARIRQRGAEDFSTYYESLCALQDTCPVASIRAGVKECVLNCQAYRLKKADWYPLLTALQINRALHTVVFYNKWKERAYPALRRNGYGRRLYKFHYPPCWRVSYDWFHVSQTDQSQILT